MEYNVQLNKLSTYIYRGKQPKYATEGIPVINQKAIQWDTFDKSVLKYHDENKKVDKRHFIKKNDVLINSTGTGTVGRVYHINYEPDLMFADSHITIVRTNEELLMSRFLYYQMRTTQFQAMILNEFLAGSTGQVEFNKSMIEKLPINVPSISYQYKVVNILSKLDKKIETNKKIIANLEELSQTLFKRWFVDFEFPDESGNPYKSSGGEMVDSELGEIPKGWNVKNLDDIANYVNGLAMQKFKPTDNQNSLPVVKIKELKNGSTDENSNRCTSEIPDKALINDGDIIFSWSATLLVKMWCGGKAGLNQHLFKVSSDKYPKWFYYYWTKRYIDYFIGIANDKATTMGHINRKHLSHAKILIPNDSTLEKFSRTFDDLLEKELSVSKESKRLIELRDTLLPKLMSGEIEIPDDIEVMEDELSI
ncbi:restriction endonuclease subunit S [Staphylococcus haemolyticus]|uniref:restriction endonuclease subunit S n=1 Tax=Staphylococcus haemolyticus TaxID=1283 RepID=UPI0029008877|nr:restriction endonuclease subunit S [Staphylococcus haemolyticus]MDU0450230.1 restriction endonuclease subunit S [Staphylococcus haemolyticus]MDU0485903.1 restriction endonuclease subunit S [Staphylococcus haemolyticus]MDU0491653.1 restriction endonuclease subunit S [Staphylococcus haemolyticus]